MYMSAGNVAFLIVNGIVILGVALWVLFYLNKDKKPHNGHPSESHHDFENDDVCSDKYERDDDSLKKHTEESKKRMTPSYTGSNNPLYSFDKACSILEDRMKSCIRERRLKGIAEFELVKGNTFWQESSLRALDSEGYCLATASTDFSDFDLNSKDFDPFYLEIEVRVRKTDDGVSDKGVHVGAHSANVDEYNKWLKKYLKKNKPTHNYDYHFSSRDFVVVDDPDNYPDLYDENMCGASSLNFIIPKKYNVEKYVKKFRVGHCNVYGWSNGRAVSYGYWVPVYNDTIDKMKNVVLDPDERNPEDGMFISLSGKIFYRNAPKGIRVVQVDDTSVNQIKRMLGRGDHRRILESIFVMTDKEILTLEDILSAKKCFPENVWSKFIGEKENQDDSAPVSNPVDNADKCGEDMPSVW